MTEQTGLEEREKIRVELACFLADRAKRKAALPPTDAYGFR
jgi:hypothetical protein